MEKIAVFDFDGTIYKKDSLIEFFKFILVKKPWRIIFAGIQLFAFLLHLFKIINTTKFKELFLIYLTGLHNQLDDLVEEFWKKEFPANFNPEVLSLIKDNSSFKKVCITASPDFMFNQISNKVAIDLFISTQTTKNKPRMKIVGKNCRGEEKINRLKEQFKNSFILEMAISDNLDDKPLILLAKKRYIVKNDQIILI